MKKMGAMQTGVLGALLGAGAVALSHKPTRKKLKDGLNKFLAETDEKLDDVQNKVEKNVSKAKKQAKKNLTEGLDKARERLNGAARA